MNNIPYGRQDISESDIDSVVNILRSDYLTQGPVLPAFEKIVADYCGVNHSVAVNSATSALHIACLALDVGKGDIVWTTPITFVASANCALYCGADIDFVDIDPQTYNISLESLTEKLALAEKVGKLPKVIIPVHFSGQSCDMNGIKLLSEKYGFKIIEDASHAIGGRYKNKLIGSCFYSDITIFSFHPVKIITTGEGGMALTKDSQLAKKMRQLRNHGITNDIKEMQPYSENEIWNYQQIDLGFNYRMTDIQAALGISQMNRIDDFVKSRHEIAVRYDKLLSNLPVTTPWQHSDCYSAFHLYVIRLKLDLINKTQRQVYDGLRADGILANLHYIPVYLQPYYRKKGFIVGYCPNSEKYFSDVITIPMHPSLAILQQDFVIKSLRTILVS